MAHLPMCVGDNNYLKYALYSSGMHILKYKPQMTFAISSEVFLFAILREGSNYPLSRVTLYIIIRIPL